MGTLTQEGAAAVVPASVLVVLVLAVTVVLVRRARRVGRARQQQLDAELARSRADVERLSRRVEELGEEVLDARRSAERDREYVITSLGTAPDLSERPDRTLERVLLEPARPPVGRLLEDQLVHTLARQQDASRVRARAVDLVVRTVALGHGVRRALMPDVLDRAAAEAHVTRRRSRRARRREVREARRLIRAVRTQDQREDAA